MTEVSGAARSMIGVIGGMGPAATLDFYRKVIDETPAQCDQDHVPLVIWSDPRVPDRTQALLAGGADPTPWLEEAARRLRAAGCELVAIPCNTAHAFVHHLETKAGVHLINMVTETAKACTDLHPTPRRVFLLATAGTIRSGLYQTALDTRDIQAIAPDPAEQAETTSIIRAVKSGRTGDEEKRRIESLINAATDHGADAVILACTELPLVAPNQAAIPIIDPTRTLARAVVTLARPTRQCAGKD